MADYNANNLTTDRAFASKPAITARFVGGGGTTAVTHYHKRAWRSETPGYVYWDTTNPDEAYPGGGTLTPATGVILFKWTT